MRFDGDLVQFELRYPKDTLSTGKLRDGTPLTYPKSLTVSISHATDSNKDRDFIIKHADSNVYTGQVHLDSGIAKYYLQVSNDGIHNWRLRHTQKLPAKNAVFTPLPSFDDDALTLPDQRRKRINSSTQPPK